jgi:gliotoxin/aspirochlorine biosynthesis aminotransferase
MAAPSMAVDMGLSRRGAGNVDAILPRISAAVAERAKKCNPNIDLGTSENWLIRRELIELTKLAINDGLVEQHLSYPTGFAGDSELLDALAKFFNAHFNPHIPVEATHLATAPGAASSLDALLYNICEPGDGVLVPGPYWSKSSAL